MADEVYGEKRLWGSLQIPDAEVIEANFLNDNENLPQEGTVLAFIPEHRIEYQKCKESIHYFAENYYTIIVGGHKKELMKLWPIQVEALNFFQEHNRIVLNSSRQTSKTTMVILVILWRLLFDDGIQHIGMLGNKYELAKGNLQKLKEAFELLPLFIKPFVVKWNEGLVALDNENLCKITSTSSTAFRGSTLTSLVIDEAAFVNAGGKVDLDKDILQSLLPTLDAAGKDSFCILISTPYGMNNEFARLFFLAKDNPEKTPFRAFEILWSDHPDRDEEWFQAKIVEMGSEEAFYVEFGGSFTMGDDIKRIIQTEIQHYQENNHIAKPIFTQNCDLTMTNPPDMDITDKENDCSFQVWELPKKSRIYLAGVDVAEGVGGNYSTVEVLDVTDLYNITQVAEYQCNTIALAAFPLICLKIFNTYNQCYATVEMNNCGRDVVHALNKAHGYKKLIRHHYSAKANERMVENDEWGVISHNNSKNKAVANAYHYLNFRKALRIRSARLLKEMNGFVRHDGKNNNWTWSKMGGKESYDDLVDAFNWCVFPLHHQLVEDYFELEHPKFDDYSKPQRIYKEIVTTSDHRLTNTSMPINDTTPEIPIYTFNGAFDATASAFDNGDIEWLQSL